MTHDVRRRRILSAIAAVISGAALLTLSLQPAQAATPIPSITPQTKSVPTACGSNTSLVVPNAQAVHTYGARALFPASESGLADVFASGRMFKHITASNPTWLSSMSCTRTNLHTTPPPRTAVGATTNSIPSTTSANWSGYWNSFTPDYGTYSGYQSVYMEWSVPTGSATTVPPGNTAGEDLSIWPGIGDGGSNQSELIQAGTATLNVGLTTPLYYVWYESYPHEPNIIDHDFTITPGDRMGVQVLADNNVANYMICDYTTNNCKAVVEDDSSFATIGTTTSEYIVERGTAPDGQLMGLDHFDPITISSAEGALRGSGSNPSISFTEGSGTLGTSTAIKMEMTNCAQTLALDSVGGISTTGQFTVTFDNRGTSETCSY